MSPTIRIVRATVIRRGWHLDLVSLELDADSVPRPFPYASYPPVLRIETAQNYGDRWCREAFGIDPEIIQG